MRVVALLCALAGACVGSTANAAARMAVAPIRIELASSANFCALHVSNLGQDKVAVQVRGFAWSQDADGADRLDPADIAINPSIMELQAGQKRLVRCSLPPHAGAKESSHRLLIDELPRGNPAPGTMQTVLRLSLPIFRKLAGAAPALQWSVGDGAALELRNTGGAHALIGKLILTRAGQKTETIERGFYLLAGAHRVVPLAGDAAGITRVEAVMDTGKVDVVAKAVE
jgi:fimbrial chaperone protein